MFKFSPQHAGSREGRLSSASIHVTWAVLLVGVMLFVPLSAQDVRTSGQGAPQSASEGTRTITGKIIDSESNEPMVGVTVTVVGRIAGTITDGNGNYRLVLNDATGSIRLRFTYVGYETTELPVPAAGGTLNVSLNPVGVMGKEVIVSASRIAESVLAAPVSVERLDAVSIRETPSVNFYDAIANLKSVDMTTTSLGYKTVNARGFNSSANTRFVQVIDGMDNQAPGLNLSVGNIVGVTDLDVASAELIPGSASALYGPNALNGILVINTKSPFIYQGASARLQAGINHVDNRDRSPAGYLDAAIRYAKAFNDKFAFKVNLSFLNGEDWQATSQTNVAGTTNTSGINAADPTRNQDLLNVYGDEVSFTITPTSFNLNGIATPNVGNVSRTGYDERDLVDYGVKSFRGNVQLAYRITDNIEASVFYSYGQGTTVYQAANRYSLRNFSFQQLKAEIKGDEFLVRGYMTIENSGDSYDSRFLAQNINKTWVRGINLATGPNYGQDLGVVPEAAANNTWFTRYAFAFGGGATGRGFTSGNDADARRFADIGRATPGSFLFNREFERIRGLTDFRRGAKFNDQTKMYHVDGQYDFKKLLAKTSLGENLNVLIGGNFRLYDLNSNGTIFPDTVGNDISIYEYGAYGQATYKLFDGKLRVIASGRFDKNQNFDSRFTPRVALVYEVVKDNFIRVSYTTGFRMPSTQEQFIDLDVGTARLLGANAAITKPYNLTNNAWTLESVLAFSRAVTTATNAFVAANGRGPTTAESAVLARNNAGILRLYNAQPIKPEFNETYEVGYKGILKDKLFWDVTYYYTRYFDFIGFQRLVRPRTNITNPDGSPAPNAANAPLDLGTGQSIVYQLYVPASGSVFSQGVNVGLEYALYKGYRINGNYTFAELILDSNDPTYTSFNTPKHKTNLSFYNRNVVRNLGFNITWRWSDTYRWQASFGDGQVPAFNLVDAQVSYRVAPIKTVVKVGGSNILNNRHFELWGGPTVGAMYYVALTFDELFNN
jgi:iron complex outermembrane receptor protein